LESRARHFHTKPTFVGAATEKITATFIIALSVRNRMFTRRQIADASKPAVDAEAEAVNAYRSRGRSVLSLFSGLDKGPARWRAMNQSTVFVRLQKVTAAYGFFLAPLQHGFDLLPSE
jgi:hypothetical protein